LQTSRAKPVVNLIKIEMFGGNREEGTQHSHSNTIYLSKINHSKHLSQQHLMLPQITHPSVAMAQQLFNFQNQLSQTSNHNHDLFDPTFHEMGYGNGNANGDM
jgi:hypothetical protein